MLFCLSACRQLRDCPKTPSRLAVPLLPACFPGPLSNVTWTISPPQHTTVELSGPLGNMRQSLPGQPCNDSVLVKVAEEVGPIGEFCPQGAIQKLQIHYCNVTVSVSPAEGQTLSEFEMSALITEEISGRRLVPGDPVHTVCQF